MPNQSDQRRSLSFQPKTTDLNRDYSSVQVSSNFSHGETCIFQTHKSAMTSSLGKKRSFVVNRGTRLPWLMLQLWKFLTESICLLWISWYKLFAHSSFYLNFFCSGNGNEQVIWQWNIIRLRTGKNVNLTLALVHHVNEETHCFHFAYSGYLCSLKSVWGV